MIRVTVIYNPPLNASAFAAHYAGTHCKLVEKMPFLKGFSYSHGELTSSDVTKPVHLIAFLDYDNRADLDASLGSAEGQAAVADVPNFASGGVTIVTAEI